MNTVRLIVSALLAVLFVCATYLLLTLEQTVQYPKIDQMWFFACTAIVSAFMSIVLFVMWYDHNYLYGKR